MLQAFIVVLREGFEAFLIVAIILAYLRKCSLGHLIKSVYIGIAVSIAVSAALGYALWLGAGAQGPLWEGIFGLISVVFIGSFVIHMWHTSAHLKADMERHLSKTAAVNEHSRAAWGVFLFTVFMISREGMETALLLLQIQDAQIVMGALLGILGAALFALAWERLGTWISLKQFFRVTTIFLLLFCVQVGVNAFHEFTEAGVLPNSEMLHAATEPYSLDGLYGKTFSLVTIAACALWLFAACVIEKFRKQSARIPG
jgi:high-affinity iron transporter